VEYIVFVIGSVKNPLKNSIHFFLGLPSLYIKRIVVCLSGWPSTVQAERERERE
jgi:hypothetical protein